MSPRAAWRLESLGFREVYEYTAGKQEWLAHGLPREGESERFPYAGDVAHRDVATCRLDEPLGELAKRVERAAHGFALVLGEDDVVLGRVPAEALAAEALERRPDAAAGEAMDPGPVTIRANQPAAPLGRLMGERGLQTLVVTAPSGRLLGVLRREDAEAAAPAPGP